MYHIEKAFREAWRYGTYTVLYIFALSLVVKITEITATTPLIIFTVVFAIVAAGGVEFVEYLALKLEKNKIDSIPEGGEIVSKIESQITRKGLYELRSVVNAGRDERKFSMVISGEAYDKFKQQLDATYRQHLRVEYEKVREEGEATAQQERISSKDNVSAQEKVGQDSEKQEAKG